MTDIPESLDALFEAGVAKTTGNQEQAQGGTPAQPTEAPKPTSAGRREQRQVSAQTGSEDEDLGFAGTVGDLAKGVVGGLRDGAQEIGETIQWAGEGVGNAITGGSDIYYTRDDGFEWLTREEVLGRDDVPKWQTQDLIGETMVLPEVEDNETMGGSLIRGVSQFLVGFGVAGKAMTGVRVASKGGVAAKAATQGAVADFVSFDAHEERFSDFLQDNFELSDPITEYLAADEDDSILEGKLKNSLEGLGLGLATEGMVRLVKGLKHARKVRGEKGPEAAAEVMAEVIDEAQASGKLDLFDAATDPNIRTDTPAEPRVIVDGGKADPTSADPKTGEPRTKSVTERNAKKVEQRLAPKPPVDTKAFQDAIDYEMGITRAGSVPDPNRQLTGSLFNFDKMDSDLSTLDYLNMASDAIPESAMQDTKTFEKMNAEARRFLADSVDVSPEVIDASLANMAKGMKNQPGIVLAGKQLVQSLSREVEGLAYRISSGNATDLDYAKMVRLQSRVIEVSGNLKSVIKGAAQTTSAGRIHTTDVLTGKELAQADVTKQLLDSVDSAGGRDAIRKLADEIMVNKRAGNGVGGTMRVTANRKSGGFWDVTNEIRINGLLSGPRTHVVNLASNALQTVLLPSEKIIGGALGGDRTAMREGALQYIGIAHALKDSIKAAGAAAKKGRNILDPEAGILEANGSDFRAIRSDSENSLVRGVVNTLGEAIRLPSRGLLAGDELFKQINYRADLYSRLNSKASELVAGGQITKQEAATWVADRMKLGFAKDGHAKSLESIEFAREATFTNELLPRSMPKQIQNMTNSHPVLKLIIPFVRTPTNLVVASAQRTPILGLVTKTLRADLASGDPSRIARAKGKQATGALIWGSAIVAAMEGNITGSGPVDPRQRARMMETGWRPYSVKFGDKYVAYDRLDPFAMFFGIAADITDIQGQLGEAEGKQIAVAASAAVINNLASKTWLRGATDFADFINNPAMRGEQYLKTMATSFMPYSSALREGRKQSDDIMRDTRGDPYASFWELESVVNAFKNTVPGFSEELPARRSWITGEPITYPKAFGRDMVTPLGEAYASTYSAFMPIYEGTDKKDLVLDELARVEGTPSAPPREVMGIKLTPKQYETYTELNGKVRSPTTRRTMYQELEHQFKSAGYDINRTTRPDSGDSDTDYRTRVVRRTITAYRRLASEELIRLYPDLRKKVGELNNQKKTNAQSALSGVADLGR